MIPDTVSPAGGVSTASTSTEPTPNAAPRADYDQALANELSEAATLLGAALGSPAVLAQLSYSQAEIEAGVALHTAAQEAFNARQQAVGIQRTELAARDALLATVREDFATYRATVQANFPATVRTALGASGRVPADIQKLITLLRSAYAAAQKTPYAEKLATRKLPAAAFVARLKDVDTLKTLDGLAKGADKAATAATQARDKAAKALAAWVGPFRKQAKTDLRRLPELRAVLGL